MSKNKKNRRWISEKKTLKRWISESRLNSGAIWQRLLHNWRRITFKLLTLKYWVIECNKWVYHNFCDRWQTRLLYTEIGKKQKPIKRTNRSPDIPTTTITDSQDLCQTSDQQKEEGIDLWLCPFFRWTSSNFLFLLLNLVTVRYRSLVAVQFRNLDIGEINDDRLA